MTAKVPSVYWDSCVFIDCIQQHPTRYPTLFSILEEAIAGKLVIIASALVIAETTWLRESPEPLMKQTTLIADFFENPFIKIRVLDRAIAEEAANLHRQHKLSPQDAVHVATALHTNCRYFHTYDGEDRGGSKRKRYLLDLDEKIGTPPLRIMLPASIAPLLPGLGP